MSTVLLLAMTWMSTASAHEPLPAIADMSQDGNTLVFDVRLNVESVLAGIDLTQFTDTNNAPQAEAYDALRAQDPTTLLAAFADFWPTMAENINVIVDGTQVPLTFVAATVPQVGNVEDVRTSEIQFTAALPSGATMVSVGWASEYGILVFRQMGVENPFTAFLQGGTATQSFALAGGN